METIFRKIQFFFAAWAFFSLSFVWGNSPNAEVKNFIENLSSDQKFVLQKFLNALTKSCSGYVLFGDKPLSMDGCSYKKAEFPFSLIGEIDSIYNIGIQLWNDLNINPSNKEIFFLFFDDEKSNYRHIVCINRKKFLEVVNNNLSLFCYVLGPLLTAEDLLKRLLDSKDQFFDILIKDNVLLGILLGYGTENALIVSRKEYISDAFVRDFKRDFPFLLNNIRRLDDQLREIEPSLGFTSLEDELNELKKTTKVSVKLKPFDPLPLPHFGCVPQSNETHQLLNTYEANRLKIIETINEDDFLEKTLTKLFTTTSNSLEIPKVPNEEIFKIENNAEFISRLAKIIYQEIKSEKFFHNNYFKAFFDGITAHKKGKTCDEIANETNKIAYDIVLTERALKAAENLKSSNVFLTEMTHSKDYTCLIPHKLYYKILREGNGPYASQKLQSVSLHYSFTILDDKEPHPYTGIKKIDHLHQLIPGIALGLIGMRQGEERELIIHPEYGYGQNSHFPANATIIAKIQLLDFLEGEKVAQFAPPQSVETNHIETLSKKYAEMHSLEYYEYGAMFWDILKKINCLDLETFRKHFDQAQYQKPMEFSDKEEFLQNFHAYLFFCSQK